MERLDSKIACNFVRMQVKGTEAQDFIILSSSLLSTCSG